MVDLYGIKSCDTCRKARRWLDTHSIDYRWHDLREDGLDEAALQRWLDTLGSDKLVNRRSTTWRQLDTAVRDRLEQAAPAALLLDYPTLIKRPVLEHSGDIELGFTEKRYAELFDA